MKKVLFILLALISITTQAQTANGTETKQNAFRSLSPQTVTSPTYLSTMGTDGTIGRTLENAYLKSVRTININGVAQDLSADRDWQVGYADTGILTFAGLSPNSSTTINIGACKGWVIDNETNPLVPTKVYVDYAGETNKAVPAVGSAIGSYVLLNGSGITFITTQPTPAQRKTHMYLGKVGHPSGTITVVANTPDVAISPLGYTRALYNALNFINEGVRVAPNGANLNINLASGYITGSGINFVTDNTTPNRLTVNPQTPATFIYRTQTGAGGGATTTVTPGNYDVGGVVTAIPGGANTSTIQYVFYAPGAGVFIQLGQNIYASLSDAVAAADKEVFTIYPNFIDNVILIGQIVLTKSATNLSNTSQAVFLKASKLGETGGSNSGISTATLQSAYNNSLVPQITTSTSLGAMTVKRGSASDSDNILVGQNGAGTNTFEVKGNGTMTLGNGTTAIPSISFNNEIAPNTGFNHPSDGNIDIINNGNITSKHTSVSSEFFVPVAGTSFVKSGATASNILLAGGTDIPQSTFQTALTNPITGTGTTNFLPKFTGTTSLGNSQIFDNGTNVGIGTSLPRGKLHVSNGDLIVDTSGTGIIRGNNTDYGSGGAIKISSSNTTSLQYIQLGQAFTGTGAFTPVLTVDANILNVGIGTTTPVNKLGVGLPASTGGGISLQSNTGITEYARFGVINPGTDHSSFIGSISNNPFSIWANNAERVRVHTSGGVSIGNTTDLGASTLNVTGNISTIAGTTANHAVIKSQLDLKANLASPALTGTPTAPTATAGTNTTQIATTAFVRTATSATRPYLVYVALISQSGTSAPTATVLENTLGGTVVWSRNSTGNYTATLAGTFTVGKTIAFVTSQAMGTVYFTGASASTVNTINLVTKDVSNTSVDNFLTGALEIRVYP